MKAILQTANRGKQRRLKVATDFNKKENKSDMRRGPKSRSVRSHRNSGSLLEGRGCVITGSVDTAKMISGQG